jgi:hypothetical protein
MSAWSSFAGWRSSRSSTGAEPRANQGGVGERSGGTSPPPRPHPPPAPQPPPATSRSSIPPQRRIPHRQRPPAPPVAKIPQPQMPHPHTHTVAPPPAGALSAGVLARTDEQIVPVAWAIRSLPAARGKVRREPRRARLEPGSERIPLLESRLAAERVPSRCHRRTRGGLGAEMSRWLRLV